VHTEGVRSLLVLLLVAGCTKSDGPAPVPEGLVRVSDDVVVRTDAVGPDQVQVTYVLVDAQNISDRDLSITLGGDLTDAAGTVVSHLRPESLRMPAGASRTFVLLDDKDQARPRASGATIFVRGAVAPTWKPTVVITEPNAFDDHGKVMVAANVVNQAARPGRVLVLAGFHDKDGRPVQRQFDLVELAANETKVVRFIGPEGATKGAIWLGDSTY
jgi:hypothetical protein